MFELHALGITTLQALDPVGLTCFLYVGGGGGSLCELCYTTDNVKSLRLPYFHFHLFQVPQTINYMFITPIWRSV